MLLYKKLLFPSLLLLLTSGLYTPVALAQNSTTTTEESRPSYGQRLGGALNDAQAVADLANERTLERQATIAENRASASETVAENVADRQETRQATQETRQTEQVERQAVRQAELIERQTILTDNRQQRIKNLSANLSNRLEEAIKRLFVIISRLESRISKIEASGVDTTLAKENLRQATQSLGQARALLVNIDEQVNQATTSNLPYSNWQDVRVTYQQASTLIRQSHTHLRATVAALKTAGQVPTAVRNNPTSESTTTDNVVITQ